MSVLLCVFEPIELSLTLVRMLQITYLHSLIYYHHSRQIHNINFTRKHMLCLKNIKRKKKTKGIWILAMTKEPILSTGLRKVLSGF